MTVTRAGSHIEADDPHWIEWLVGSLSALIVTALIGWIGYQALTASTQAPDLTVKILTVTPASSGYRIDFEVENRAPTTAAAVVIRATAADGPDAPVDLTFDYVPAQSRARGSVTFPGARAAIGFSLRPVGFTAP